MSTVSSAVQGQAAELPSLRTGHPVVGETVSAVAELAQSLKGVARWFLVITAMAAIALWTLNTDGSGTVQSWLPFIVQCAVIGSWACVGFVILPVIAGVTGLVSLVAPHLDVRAFIPNRFRKKRIPAMPMPEGGEPDTPGEPDKKPLVTE